MNEPMDELSVHQRIAARLEDSARDMLIRLHQLKDSPVLSADDRDFVAESIAHYEAAIPHWEALRSRLDRLGQERG